MEKKMAITRYSSFDITVNTIAERNAILNKVNHMTVVVKDAIADPSAGAGKAVYRWDAVDENWILVSKSNCYTISFATEELTITNSEVQLSNYPVDNKVWNAVILNGNTILGDLNLSAVTISNSKITNIDPTYNGNTLRVTYAYGSIAVQINEAIEDKVDAAILNNVKTINGVEIIGTGNIVVEGVLPEMKTINSESILGTGDITISTAFADITSKPTTLSGYGITDAYTKTEVESKIVELSPPTDISMKADITYVDSKVAGIVDASPETLNTLNELAAALGDDPNFATTVSNQIGTKANSADVYTKTQVDSSLNTKVDKVTGKGLSTEDYTSAEKSKLASIENNANNYILPVASATVLGGVKAGTNISIDANGVISANDTSVAWSEITSKPTFATVATSGSYVDLSNKPTIPTTLPASDVYAWAKASTKPSYTYSEITGTPTIPAAQVQSDWNATTGMGVILNKPTIPTTVSSFTNDSGYQNATQVNTAIQAVVGAAPAALDTLAEIATQLANDESVVSALTNTVAGKQATLVSGTNIKTINGTSVLGSGDIVTTQTTITGNAGTATTLQTARTIGASGDVTGTATSFNGSANITIPMTLASVGTAGTYTKVTTDAKGRVTSGTTLSASDIPTLNQNTTGTAGSVVNSEVIKFDTGTTEGTDLYTFNGSSNKTIDIKAGTNITLTKTAGSITISANDTSVAWSEITSKPTTLSGYGITDSIQSTLVSGTSIKTINGTSVLGSGDITISGGATLADDTSTNSTYYPTFAIATSGNMSTAKVSSTKLTFNPSTGTLAATELNSLSDVNKKENITNITNGLEIINKLNGVEFDWKENGNHSSGVIAQELEKVLPFLVTEIEGTKTVNYLGIIGYLINAVQELSKKNKEVLNGL
jgi:hypothetical protein